MLDYILLLSQQNLLKMSAKKNLGATFEKEHDRVHAVTNDIHNGKDVFITIGALLPISRQMAVAQMEVTVCV